MFFFWYTGISLVDIVFEKFCIKHNENRIVVILVCIKMLNCDVLIY